MKNFIEILEQVGQTKSLKQADSISQIFADVDCDLHAFKTMVSRSNELVCVLLPDDDDEE